jgi:SMODS and SLOG-associating 2TM effector domain 1
VKAREGAEGLKSIVFEFLMGTGEFSGADAAQKLLARRGDIERDLGSMVAPDLPDKDAEADFPTTPATIDTYRAERALEQVKWFAGRLLEHHRKAGQLEGAAKLLGGIGVVLGVLGPLGVPLIGSWVPVLTAVAGALVAQIGAGHYRFLARSYQDTAAAVRRELAAWTVSPPGADRDARLVTNCEATLRAEQARWVQEMLSAAGPKPVDS